MLRPVREGNAFEEAIQRILQAIKLGAVTTGDRLPPERDLARRLGISRATLREALQALGDAGYVAARRGRGGGTFVVYEPEAHSDEASAPALAPAGTGPRPAGGAGPPRGARPAHGRGEHLDILVLRRALEPGVAELAAERTLDDATRDTLRARLAEVPRAGSRAAHRLADARLHLAIAEVTGSAALIAAVADVQMSLGDLLAAIPVLPVNIEHSHRQHRAVVDAVLAGDAAAARARMRAHVDATAALLEGFLGGHGAGPSLTPPAMD
ncbi:MAG TPA: FCD domain-containing protein [Euzebyales bacterium]|nr:FCD domain-containing protein [Euzebyales bacterium]